MHCWVPKWWALSLPNKEDVALWGILIMVKFIYNFVLHACSLKHVSRLQPEDRAPRTQADPGHLRDSNFICLHMHLSENCFAYYSFQSQINYIRLHKHLWSSSVFQGPLKCLQSNKCPLCLFLNFISVAPPSSSDSPSSRKWWRILDPLYDPAFPRLQKCNSPDKGAMSQNDRALLCTYSS